MCAASALDCLRNENGCPEKVPYKCIYTGQCVVSSDQCIEP